MTLPGSSLGPPKPHHPQPPLAHVPVAARALQHVQVVAAVPRHHNPARMVRRQAQPLTLPLRARPIRLGCAGAAWMRVFCVVLALLVCQQAAGHIRGGRALARTRGQHVNEPPPVDEVAKGGQVPGAFMLPLHSLPHGASEPGPTQQPGLLPCHCRCHFRLFRTSRSATPTSEPLAHRPPTHSSSTPPVMNSGATPRAPSSRSRCCLTAGATPGATRTVCLCSCCSKASAYTTLGAGGWGEKSRRSCGGS